MAWKIDTNKTPSLSEGSSKLPVGRNIFKIVDAMQVVDKQDPTGRARQVVFTLETGGRSYKAFLSPESTNDIVAEIACKTLRDFFFSCGVLGAAGPEKLPKLKGKVVVVTVTESYGKGDKADKVYTNIAAVEAYENADPEPEGEVDTPPEEPDDAPVEANKKRPWD